MRSSLERTSEESKNSKTSGEKKPLPETNEKGSRNKRHVVRI